MSGGEWQLHLLLRGQPEKSESEGEVLRLKCWATACPARARMSTPPPRGTRGIQTSMNHHEKARPHETGGVRGPGSRRGSVTERLCDLEKVMQLL